MRFISGNMRCYVTLRNSYRENALYIRENALYIRENALYIREYALRIAFLVSGKGSMKEAKSCFFVQYLSASAGSLLRITPERYLIKKEEGTRFYKYSTQSAVHPSSL
jgi:hypothetical protein